MNSLSKILVSQEWMKTFPKYSLHSLSRIKLDHNPLLVEIKEGLRKISPFRIKNM